MAIAPDNFIILRAGKFDPAQGGGADSLNREFAALTASRLACLTIYVHGGLVPLLAGETAANTLNPLFSSGNSNALFVIWETGIEEILTQNLPAIFNEDIFQRILRRVTQFVKGKLDKSLLPGAPRTAGGLPLTPEDQIQAEINTAQIGGIMFPELPRSPLPPNTVLTAEERAQIQQEIQNDLQLQIQASRIANARAAPALKMGRSPAPPVATVTLMDPEVLNEIAPRQAGARGVFSTAVLALHIISVVANVIERFATHRDHGPYLTIVEETMREFYVRNAGEFVWDGIKQEIDEAFGVADDCGGSALVAHLKTLWTGGVKPRVMIIGHSAGAIYVSRLLKELDAALPADFQAEVAFLAPACTFEAFTGVIKQAGRRIPKLRIFGMGDPLERKNALVPLIYPASLLYFISGVLEAQSDEPLLGMQRYYDFPAYTAAKFPEIAFVKSFGALSSPRSFAWADITQGAGANCDMHTHGGWITDAPATLASILEIVQNGI